MPRYAAFLRGVSPMNATMPELKRAFEEAGFTEVRTVLSSGNVVFDARKASTSWLERKAEAAMAKRLGKSFLTIVRSIDELRELLAKDPYERFWEPPAQEAATCSPHDRLRHPLPPEVQFTPEDARMLYGLGEYLVLLRRPSIEYHLAIRR